MQCIIGQFCAYGMEYKDDQGYNHDWFTLLPQIQVAYNTSHHSTTGKKPFLKEKGWNPLLPVNHLRMNPSNIHPTAKDFHDMPKKAFDTEARCIAEVKENKKQRYYKTHKEPEFREGDQVLVPNMSFDKPKGLKKM
ncbi:hypothetical protein O181_103830 [Austropuccinia psidii MF-1]|uniref:Integrase catalytic domain-containing protein n=1 Tax=Austropuccinia psidii MF-1 TaxID=1389203 RepID=A0A9Q3JMC1_9BASI|nr:hypothetical protein [Austropuccinia psidii MF-1]